MAYVEIPASSSGLTTTDQSYLDYLSGRWEQTQERFLLSKVTQLTGFESVKVGWYPIGGSAGITTADGLIEGGAGASPAGNATWQSHGYSMLQTIKTAYWGAVWRAKFAAPTTARISRVGLSNSFTLGGARTVTFGTNFDNDAAAQTHYVFTTATGTLTTSVLADTSWHWFAITSDLTNLTLWVDSVSAGTRPCSALTDEGMYEGIANTTAGEAKVSKILFGYVEPS